jgi:hypothetical protein
MGVLRTGVHQPLEDEADAMLKLDLAKTSSVRDRGDILTPSKEALRRRREVLVASGTPDPSVRQGIYGRALNRVQTHLNSREGGASGGRRTVGGSKSAASLSDFVERQFG